MIGDRHTAALVGTRRLGRLAVPAPLRLPRLLRRAARRPRTTAAGCSARPATTSVRRRYVGDSAALETTFTTDTGAVTVLDVMPIGDGRADVVRRIIGVEGTVADAPRVGGAVRLRQDPALGAPPGAARRPR